MVYLKIHSEFENKEDWIKEIIKEIKDNTERKMAFLLIYYNIKDIEELYEAFKKAGYPEYKMEKYQRNNLGELKKTIFI